MFFWIRSPFFMYAYLGCVADKGVSDINLRDSFRKIEEDDLMVRRVKIMDPSVFGIEGGIIDNPVGSGDFQQCVQLFLDDMEIRNYAFHTRRWHKENLHYVEKTLTKLDFPTEPNYISEESIKKCILYWKRENKLSPTTINHRIRSLKQMYFFLGTQGVSSNMPVNNIPKLKAPTVIIQPFDEAQLKRLFAMPDKSTFVGYRDYCIMLVLLDTGVRLIELENMLLSNIDLDKNNILVMGKGSKEREVPFQATTKQYLLRYLRLRGKEDHDYFWVNQFGGKLNRKTIQERLQIYGEKAKLNGVRVSPHTFRHTCAKMYLLSGGDILSLQKLLGHSSLDMVRHYVELWGSDLQKMHKKHSPVEGLFRR